MNPAPILRPLSFAEVLDGAFSLYRRRFALFFGLAALPSVVALAMILPLFALQWTATEAWLYEQGSDPLFGGMTVAIVLVGLVTGVLSLLSWGALVHAAAAVYRGEPVSARESLRHARGRLAALTGGSLAGMAAGMLVMGTLVAVGVAAPLTLLFILPLCFALGVAMLVLGAVWLPVVVLERAGPFDAFRRAGELTDGAWGRAAGTVMVLWMIAWAIGGAVQAGVMVLSLLVGGIVVAMGGGAAADPGAASAGFAAIVGVAQLAATLGSTLGLPVVAIGTTLHYLDRRVRTEALDLADAPPTAAVPA